MGLGDGDLIFNCFSSKLQPLPYLVLERLKKQKKRPISGIISLRNMYTASSIFELLGDGDLSVSTPSNLRVFLCHEFLQIISKMD